MLLGSKIKRLEGHHSTCYLRGALRLRSNHGYPCLCGDGLPAVPFSATSQTRPGSRRSLRQQLAVFKRKHPRPKLDRLDRLFWIVLCRLWEGWFEALIIVKPETVVRKNSIRKECLCN